MTYGLFHHLENYRLVDLKIPFRGGYQQWKQTGCWQSRLGHSLMKPAKRKLLVGPPPPRLPSLWPGSTVVPHVTAHPPICRQDTKWLRTVFLMQSYCLVPGLWLLPKSRPDCLAVKAATLHGVLSSLSPGRLIVSDLCRHTQSCWLCVTAVGTFFSYSVAVPVWSVDCSHITLAFETKWCHVFGFLNHWYDNGIIPFIAKATQLWADSQDIW